jgi:neutral trehalase|eukprot:COSAG01_NODE_1831_length_9117_cov_3.960080_6_plen_106_part_00
MAWLKSYMPTLRAAAAFCFDLIDSKNHLLLAPGSLMIDVFIRANYTLDSNAMIVGFLKEFADAEEAVGNTTGATALRTRATEMAASVNKYLWDTDHYVTQVRPIS